MAIERSSGTALFTVLVALALAATFVIVVLSAYIRLDKTGVGCNPWPQCYGEHVAETSAFSPPTKASVAHRFVASALGALVIALAFISLRSPFRASRAVLAWLAFVLTVFLALLGVYTPGSSLPAVIVGNLLGGFLLLTVLWWLYLNLQPLRAFDRSSVQTSLGLVVAIVLSLLSIFVGAVAAAYLAGGTCTVNCPLLPDPAALSRVDLFAPLPAANERREIASSLHILHRTLGALAAIASAVIAFQLRRASSAAALLLGALALSQVSLGWIQILLSMPLSTAVAHNAVAALLLLALLANVSRLRMRS